MTTTATYPTLEQINGADVDRLLRWNRQLPSPTTRPEAAALTVIVDRLREARDANPRAYTAASKAIGW